MPPPLEFVGLGALERKPGAFVVAVEVTYSIFKAQGAGFRV